MLEADQSWQYKNIPILSGGLNADEDASVIDDAELVRADNVDYDESILVPVDGYAVFAGDIAIRGHPRRIVQYTELAGTERLVLITNDTMYEKVGTEWHYVGDGADTELDAAAAQNDTTISVDDSTGFTAGEYIGIGLDNGSQHQTTIASVDGSGDNITIDDALPSSAAAASDVVQAPVLNGLDEEYVDYVVVFSQNWLVVTNGVDVVKRFDGTNLEDAPGLPSSGNTVAKLVQLFGNRLCLLRTVEGGSSRPHRFRWSAKGDPTDWSGADTGFTDIIDTEDLIVAAERLGPYLVIYKELSIVRTAAVETSVQTFEFANAVIGEGAASPGAVAVRDNEHILVGRYNIYKYLGGNDLQPVGNKIFRSFISSRSDLNRERAERVFATAVSALDEVWFFLVTGGNNYPDKALRLDFRRSRWTVRVFNHGVVDMAEYSEFGITTYNDLAGTTYNDLSGRSYNSFAPGAGNISYVFPSPDGNTTYRIQNVLSDDDGTDIEANVETRDFGNPHFKGRLNSLDIEGRSNSNVEVYYSVDRGQNWTKLGDFNTNGAWDFARLHAQLVFKYIRFRFKVTGDASFALKGIGITFRHESDS